MTPVGAGSALEGSFVLQNQRVNMLEPIAYEERSEESYGRLRLLPGDSMEVTLWCSYMAACTWLCKTAPLLRPVGKLGPAHQSDFAPCCEEHLVMCHVTHAIPSKPPRA